MGQLQLCTKKYAIASNNQIQVNTESIVKFIFDNGRILVIRQTHAISLLLLLFVMLLFLLPGHAIAESSSITSFSQFQDCLACDSDGSTPNTSLDGPFSDNPENRIHYTGITSIPLSIDSSNREES